MALEDLRKQSIPLSPAYFHSQEVAAPSPTI